VLHRHRDASVLAGPVFSLDPLPVPTVDRASTLSSEADCVTFHVGEDIVTTHPTLNTSSDYATLPQAFAIVQFKGALRQDSSFAEDLADQLAAAYSIESKLRPPTVASIQAPLIANIVDVPCRFPENQRFSCECAR